jgi:hypothetical protein
MPLPDVFCWTRFGTEAGQGIDGIFKRKEEERLANRGVFYWGIGNAIGPSVRGLLSRTADPEVLFSPIKSAPRPEDALPAAIAAWTSAETLTGERFELPASSLITSRYDRGMFRLARYALVCFSEISLFNAHLSEKITPSELRNLMSQRPVGSSQVTAVVENVRLSKALTPGYDVSIRAKLVPPYFLRLSNPVPLPRVTESEHWEVTVRQAWEQKLPNRLAEFPNCPTKFS